MKFIISSKLCEQTRSSVCSCVYLPFNFVTSPSTFTGVTVKFQMLEVIGRGYAAAQLIVWSPWDFSSTSSFWPHYGHRVDSVCNTNEYRGYLLGVKAICEEG